MNTTILDRFKLDGKVAVVTGASRGLGQGMSLALAEAGADIAAVDILPMDDTAKLVRALGRKCAVITGNLGDRKSIPNIIVEAKKTFEHLDILVNCAGIIRREAFEKFSEKDWDDVMGININGVFFLSQCFVRDLLARARSSTSPRCFPSRAASASRPTPPRRAPSRG
jgi:2-deoxy-D-gluconate 3-dehydrogenase